MAWIHVTHAHSAVRRAKVSIVACILSPCLGLMPCLGIAVVADGRVSTPMTDQVTGHHIVIPKHRSDAVLSGTLDLTASPAATTADPKERVLHHFSSPRHGAYPDNGVIRDRQGNLYGTTNGSFSDIGGGGPKDAGVVFKVDSWGLETVLYSFTGGVDGSSPNGVVQDDAGNLYGTTSYGGGSGAGVVFKLEQSGSETVLYSFTGGADGANPNSVIRDKRGNLYGATGAGGAAGYGVIFKIDASGKQTVLHSFTGGADGAYPNAVLALDARGNLYGATNSGGISPGTAGAGVVFKLDEAGKETVLYTFSGGSDGAQPNGVLLDAKGDLFGAASGGGAADAGVVFKIDPSGHEFVLYSFSGGNDGGYPNAGVTLDSNGNLFGTTSAGGKGDYGVVYKLDTSGHETVLHTFARGPYGLFPNYSGVILDPECNLYGTAAFGGAGGDGVVYKLDPVGNPSVVYAFPGNERGQYPYNGGVMLSSDGYLYGNTFYGGRHGVGVVYRLDSDADERDRDEHVQVLYTFDQLTTRGYGQGMGTVARDPAGNLYGATFLGQTDIDLGYGVIYKVDPAGHATVLHNFTGGADGANPYDGVIVDSKGVVYGTALGGGASNNGVVFEIDAAGHETVLYSFTGGNDGGSPFGVLIRDQEGNFYGTTNAGGTANAGVIFKLDTTGHETVLYSFSGGDDGSGPLAGLVRDAAGNFYGTTNGGGASGAGVVFKLDALGHESVLHTFSGGEDGGYPLWVTLARDAAGNLYGTTAGGGNASGDGVVFKIDPSGHETLLHTFTGGDDGGNPYTGVILGPEGRLYGTTAFGGQSDVGVIFEIAP
jgi:uncharacterized repeat protein (TIGR03803 family)